MTEAAAPHPRPGAAPRARRPGGPPRLLSDSGLARRAAQGDQRAFEEIYRRYHQDLYRFCLAMLGSPQDAQDTLQNAMLKVLRALPGEERHIQLKPWLYRIARNEAVETVRRRRASTELEPDGAASPERIAETAETRERLRRLIADLGELPERQRAALVMRELAGLGFGEIGASFETSAAVARQTVYEARLSLRQMEAGREMSCEQVMRELSDADGRVTRRREIRAHLRACSSCRAFSDSIGARRGELAAIAPLPLALSAGLLHSLFSGQASAAVGGGTGAAAAAGAAGGTGMSAGGIAGTVGAGAGKAIATSAILKAAATVAVVAVGVTAADRGGLIEVPGLSGSGASHTSTQSPSSGGAAAQGAAGGEAEKAGGNAESRQGAGSGRRGAAAVKRRRSGPAGARSRGHGASQARGHGHAGAPPLVTGHGLETAESHAAEVPHANGGAARSHRHAASHRDGSSHGHRGHARRKPHRTNRRRTPAPKPPAPKQGGGGSSSTSPQTSSEPSGSEAGGTAQRPATLE
jgi:RNA polymerase sigma factor (sigma-70 family)